MAKKTEQTDNSSDVDNQMEFKKDGATDFSTLGIGTEFEDDRIELDERGPMQIIRFRIDQKTQYYDKESGEGGILKFDGFDIATGQPIKYRTLSRVAISQFNEIASKVGIKVQDINNVDFNVFISPVNVLGFEKVKSSVKGRNPYIRIKAH